MSQKLTVAAMWIADRNVWAQWPNRVAMRLQSLSFANRFSTLWRCLYMVLQYVAGSFRFDVGGIQGEMPRSIRAA